MRPLRHHRRTAAFAAMVREDEAARRARDCRRRKRGDRNHPRELARRLFRVDAQHSRLVHLAATLVGTPHSGMALRTVQGDDRRAHGSGKSCAHCGSGRIVQDNDVLETWLSSALWPFSTLGWPDNTSEDFRAYYPTKPAGDRTTTFLFFWVARMIMMGIHFTSRVPFRHVYLHSLVRTADGQKMSKSKGTGIDPIELNRKFGTDAMRFTLASMAAPGTDIVLSEDRIASYRNFANKIWNAARFIFVNLEKFQATTGASIEELGGAGSSCGGALPGERPGAAGRPLDFFAPGAGDGHGQRCSGKLSLPRSGARHLSLFLGRLLRLVHRMGEAGDGRCQPEDGTGVLAQSLRRVRGGAAPAASVHALPHRGVVAPSATTCGRPLDCAGTLPRSADVLGAMPNADAASRAAARDHRCGRATCAPN